jgi:hypothetical protein
LAGGGSVAAEIGEKRWRPGLGKEVIGGDLAHPGSIPPVEMLRATARIPWCLRAARGSLLRWRHGGGATVGLSRWLTVVKERKGREKRVAAKGREKG